MNAKDIGSFCYTYIIMQYTHIILHNKYSVNPLATFKNKQIKNTCTESSNPKRH